MASDSLKESSSFKFILYLSVFYYLGSLFSGIGFLGAGVIVHQGASGNVRGLTTAASIWVVAIIGCCFGAGQFVS